MENRIKLVFISVLIFTLIPIFLLRAQVNLNFYLSPGYTLTTEDLTNCRFSVQSTNPFWGVAELIVTDKMNNVQVGSLLTNSFRLSQGNNQFSRLNIPGIKTYQYNSNYIINNFFKGGTYDV